MTEVVHPKKFHDNTLIYQTKDTIKELHSKAGDSGDEEVEKKKDE